MAEDAIYDVVIIGAGPAGLTAGLYASRSGLKVLALEGMAFGGQAAAASIVENYPGFPMGVNGPELMQSFREQAFRFGLRSASGEAKSIIPGSHMGFKSWRVAAGDKEYHTLSIIAASGGRPKKLDIPGEKELHGKGVSYCAVCDGPLFRDKDIVVIGGGDVAVEESLFLASFGKKVTLVHRREKLRAAKILQERAVANKKMNFLWGSAVTEICGKDRVEGVRVKDLKTLEESVVACQGVFVFIGFTPNTDFLGSLTEKDETGHIVTDSEMRTSAEGIFSCGDCRSKLFRQIITACGDGAVAAFSAKNYLEGLKK